MEGLEEIKRIRYAAEALEEQKRFDQEKINSICKALYDMIMKEVEIIVEQ